MGSKGFTSLTQSLLHKERCLVGYLYSLPHHESLLWAVELPHMEPDPCAPQNVSQMLHVRDGEPSERAWGGTGQLLQKSELANIPPLPSSQVYLMAFNLHGSYFYAKCEVFLQ